MAAAGRRLPDWLKVKPPSGDRYTEIKALRSELGLATVCEEARCPNISECWGGGTATFMVLGDTCTRGCRFCAVTSAREGRPVDPLEPAKLAHAIETMGLDYAVITMVDRDELPDQGAAHVAACIRAVKKLLPHVLVEMLTGDFQGRHDLVDAVVDARPDVFAHNVETVRRLTPSVRDRRASYDQSLDVLRRAKERDPAMPTKSSIMVGLGETEDEVAATMDDLRAAGVDFLTVGQYLRPSDHHVAVERYVPPGTFERYGVLGLEKGFGYVASGPLVRSSYRAGEFFIRSHIASAGVAT